MHYLFEHLGVAVCAATGALAGRGKRVDLFGVVVLALVTAVGGGTLRDLVLGATPVFWVRDGSFVLTAVGTALLTFTWGRFGKMPHGFLLVADACGLALFTTVGTEKSLAYGAPAVVAVALGVVTGVAGGVIRDALSGEVPLVFRPEIYLYATAACCGAVVLVLLEKLQVEHGTARLVGRPPRSCSASPQSAGASACRNSASSKKPRATVGND